MTFEEAETRYRELRTRMERGETISRSKFEEQVSQLAVQHDGLWWEIHPHTGKWMYFDGSGWVEGMPPGRGLSAEVPPTPMPVASAPVRGASTRERSRLRSRQGQPPAIAPSPDRTELPVRASFQKLSSARNQGWIPFAVGAVILFFCSILLFVGGPLVLGLSSPPTPTQTIAVLPTPTLVPTLVRVPTLPLPTATPTPVLAKVIERRVNVRAGPSLNAIIVGKIQQDDLITLIGVSQDGKWYQVIIAGRAEPAWVFGETLEVTSGDPQILPVVAAPSP